MKSRPNPHSRLLDADEVPEQDPIAALCHPWLRDAGPTDDWLARFYAHHRATVAPRGDARADATADGAVAR